jgi:hypothetical protein
MGAGSQQRTRRSLGALTVAKNAREGFPTFSLIISTLPSKGGTLIGKERYKKNNNKYPYLVDLAGE